MEEKQKKATKDVLLDFYPYIIIILCVLILRTFIATPVKVNGPSMEPTLMDKDTMILNKLSLKTRGVKRWDIIVVKTDDTYLIKRIIALPGETIRYEDDVLYIDGEEVEDNYSLTKTEDFDERKVGENEYYVMGDNRYISQDSRAIGPVEESEIIGIINLRLFPLDKAGKIK